MSPSGSALAINPGPIIAVTGLALEAKIAEGRGVQPIIGGGNAATLEAALKQHISRGACGIISFGICGGLKQDLVPGTCIVGREVIAPTSSFSTHRAWSDAIAACVPRALRDNIAAVDAPISSPEEKTRLAISTRAIAVDTESHIAAKLALQHKLPFVIFRVIADPAGRSLPRAAEMALRTDGRIDAPAVLRSVVRTPGQIPLLIRLGFDTWVALRALTQSRRRLGAAMGYPNLSELLLDMP